VVDFTRRLREAAQKRAVTPDELVESVLQNLKFALDTTKVEAAAREYLSTSAEVEASKLNDNEPKYNLALLHKKRKRVLIPKLLLLKWGVVKYSGVVPKRTNTFFTTREEDGEEWETEEEWTDDEDAAAPETAAPDSATPFPAPSEQQQQQQQQQIQAAPSPKTGGQKLQIEKGSMCWYRDSDGSAKKVEVLSVDRAIIPPTYVIRIDGRERETEVRVC
jgi:hypothetical protein